MPKIAVIVPIFNAEPFLEKCLYSIVDQTLSDIEIVCVDNCSSDDSAKIVENLARNDSRIRLFSHQTNLGPGGARNTGIAEARAEYLAFVDSDDFIDINMLATLFESAEAGKFDIVESGCRAIDENGETIWEYCPEKRTISDLKKDPDRMFQIREWGLPQKLWRKSLFANNDLIFPTHVYWEDISLIPVLLLSASNLKKLDSVFYNYTQRKNSITNSVGPKHIIDMFKALDHIRGFLKDNGIYEQERENFKKAVKYCMGYLYKKMRDAHTSSDEDVSRVIERCDNFVKWYLGHEDAKLSSLEQQIVEMVAPTGPSY